MAITETIKSSAYRVWSTALGHWKKYSLWNLAKDTEFDDGNNAETKVGAINGITSSLVSTATDIAASASTVYKLNKKLSNHFEISEATLSSYTLATAIGLLLANASEKGTYSGRFKCSPGWFTFHCYYANDGGYNSGYVCSISDGTAYTFYCKAGADAVLKKLGSPEIRTKTVTNASGSFDAGGTVLFAGFVKTTWHISTYEQKYGHSSYPLATVTYSGSTITYSMNIDKTKENDVSGQDSYSATIIYAIE